MSAHSVFTSLPQLCGCQATRQQSVATAPFREAACVPQEQLRKCCIRRKVRQAVTASAIAAAEKVVAESPAAAHVPSGAVTTRSIADIVSNGTLSTTGEDGVALGTYVSFLLWQDGQPILRLRENAVHTSNLSRESRCSLFLQCADYPARLLARATLIGEAVKLEAEEHARALDEFQVKFAQAVGVDAPRKTDLFYRLNVEQVFYVGGLGTSSGAEIVPAEDYMAASPDVLHSIAADLVTYMNQQRPEDVIRIAADAVGASAQALEAAEMLWLDSLGLYLYVKTLGEEGHVIRVTFQRPVVDERNAKSALTMLAQLAWERERNYNPVAPEGV